MKAAADTLGLKVVTTETFGSRDTDFSAQLTEALGAKPDALAISALVEPICGVLLQARQLGFGPKTQVLAGNGANSPKVAEIAGAAADGLLVGSPWFIGKPDPVNRAFVDAFRAKYGRDPDQFAAQAYDTMFILAEAIDRAGAAEPDKIRDALTKTDHTGVMGRFRFDDHRSPASNESVVVLVMRGGKYEIAP
jgi:branched-chain amino acid transport system substrate-binding protein